jgi:hypothetical protein
MSYDNDWYFESIENDRIVLRRSNSGGGAFVIIGILYMIGRFIAENWIYIVAVLGIVIVCVLACVFISANAKKPALKILSVIALSILLIMGVFKFVPTLKNSGGNSSTNYPVSTSRSAASNVQPARTSAYVNSGGLNVRNGPSASYGIITVLDKNSPVEVLDDSGNWWKVRVNGAVGYVNSHYLRS